MLDLTIPEYTFGHYCSLVKSVDPIEEYAGISVKNGNLFRLGPLTGSKVRQCLHVVNANLHHIRNNCGGGILTGAGLPSPQTAIVAGVAKYFGLKCAVTVPEYRSGMRDFSRINASLSHHFGSKVYGVKNPYPIGHERDAQELCKELGFYQVQFGMCGDLSMEPVIRQVQNIPEYVKRIIIVAGSGLSALSILRGIAKYKKLHITDVYIVTLSGRYSKSKRRWYDRLPNSSKFAGNVEMIQSKIPYRTEFRAIDPETGRKMTKFDLTYESKAFDWMIKNVPMDRSSLFWVVGKRIYDLDVIVDFEWHLSKYEEGLRNRKSNKQPSFF